MEKKPERRAFRRFEVILPATVKPAPDEKGNGYNLMLTRDISSSGAYFKMLKPFTYDGHVQVEMLIDISCDYDKIIYIYLTASGNVVRCDESGMAVHFSEDFSLTPFQIQ